MSTTQHVWMTRQAHDRLRAELDELLNRRTSTEDSDDATTSLDFDQEVVLNEVRRRSRIRQIEEMLRHAVVGETPPDDGVAETGMVLTVRFDNEDETTTFLLGLRDGAARDHLEIYSPTSPLGTALWGAKQGEQRTYRVPSGDLVRVTLERAVPYGQHLLAAK